MALWERSTAMPVRYVPQAIGSVKTTNVLDYGINDLGTALSDIPDVSSGANRWEIEPPVKRATHTENQRQ